MSGRAQAIARIEREAKEIRKRILWMHQVGTNVGSAMSCADILATLYFGVLHLPTPLTPDRDRFILSKGHAASAQYAALARRGFIEDSLLATYRADGSPLVGHPVRGAVPGIEVSTGSLGHGLPIATGMAYAAKLAGEPQRTFVLLGDGECQEGSIWEAAAIAARLRLDNLIAIVDANGLQGYGRSDDILPRASLYGIWAAFGWEPAEVDGHDPGALLEALSGRPQCTDRPRVLIARTIKGKGVREMEDRLEWHYYSVPADKLPGFIAEVEGGGVAAKHEEPT